jgi:2-iminobutanoate/2-iminopropanoate deaminase
MSGRATLTSPAAPAPLGPFPHALAWGELIFVSGQGAFDPGSGALVGGSFEEQAAQTFENVEAILATAGSGFDLALVVRIYLTDLDQLAAMNAVYQRFVPADARPARTTVAVAALPGGTPIEVDAVACRREAPR